MKRQYKPQNYGLIAEKLVEGALENKGLRYTKEKIAHSKSTAKTSKGEFDFRVHLKSNDYCIEVKTNAKSITIPNLDNRNPNIKTHQLGALRAEKRQGNRSGLLLNYRENETWIFLSISDFDKMIAENYPMKSITVDRAEKYGKVIGKGENLELDFISG